MRNQRERGMAAETAACRFLKLQGYEILERNFTAKTGEIDIIARQDGWLVFVEVKYRQNTAYGDPGEAVNVRKQNRIRRTAEVYLKKKGWSFAQPIRFDVVEILGKKIRVIKHAF